MESDKEKDELEQISSAGVRRIAPRNSDGHFLPDHIAAAVISETKDIDFRDGRESVDELWAEGWHLHPGMAHRINYDTFLDRCVKVFPSRYRLCDFRLSKSMRRVLVKNKDLACIIRPLEITPDKEYLNTEHNWFRLGEGPRESLAYRWDYASLFASTLMEVCCYDAEELVAFSIFEVGEQATLGDIGVWSPRFAARSLGTLTILKEIEYALSIGADHYYFGPFYAQNPNYGYKTRFPGLELYDWDNKRWVDFHDQCIPEMLREEFA